MYSLLYTIKKLKLIGASARKRGRRSLQIHVSNFFIKYEQKHLKEIFPNGIEPDVNNYLSPSALRTTRSSPYSDFDSGLPAYFDNAYTLFRRMHTMDDYYAFENYIWRKQKDPEQWGGDSSSQASSE